jgi:threonine synthase
VITACRKSGGTGHLVSDEEVYAAQKRLAREEGIFSEPAGAVALAGILNASKHGDIAPSARVVALVTGSGFKDAHSIESMNAGNECPLVEPDQLFS